MFKFGQSAKKPSSSRLPEMLTMPAVQDLRSLSTRAKADWQNSIELPFRTDSSSITFTIVVKCERNLKLPSWSLYRTDLPGAPTLWCQQSSDIDLIFNLIELECTAQTTGTNQRTSAPGPADPASAPAVSYSSNSRSSAVNPYLARLQESGKYTDESAKPSLDVAETPAEQSQAAAPAPLKASGQSLSSLNSDLGERTQASADFDRLMTDTKQKKDMMLRGVITKIQMEGVSESSQEVIDVVKHIIDPFNTANLESTMKQISDELAAMLQQHGDAEVACTLVKIFTAMRHGHPTPNESPLEETISKWFW